MRRVEPHAKQRARAPRSDRRTTETRERILEVAEQQIALHGVEGFQIKTVAEAVGIPPPSVFAHLRGREDIAAEVAVRIVSWLGQLLARGMVEMDGFEDALRHEFEQQGLPFDDEDVRLIEAFVSESLRDERRAPQRPSTVASGWDVPIDGTPVIR